MSVAQARTVLGKLKSLNLQPAWRLSPAGAAVTCVEIELSGLEGREIVETDNRFRFGRTYATQMPGWKHRCEGTDTELIARPRELAAVAARALLARFGLDVSLETLARRQAEIAR